MKRLILFLLAAGSGSALSAQSPDAMTQVRRSFDILQKKDSASYLALFPNLKQMQGLMRSVMTEMKDKLESADPSLNVDSLISAEVARMSEGNYENEIRSEVMESFRNLLRQSARKGVDWSQVRFTAVTIDTPAVSKPGTPKGLKEASGVIDFTSRDSAYRLRFANMLHLPSEQGWYGIRFAEVIRKGETFAGDDEEMEVRDVELGEISEPPPPPPAKPKKSPASSKPPVKKPATPKKNQ